MSGFAKLFRYLTEELGGRKTVEKMLSQMKTSTVWIVVGADARIPEDTLCFMDLRRRCTNLKAFPRCPVHLPRRTDDRGRERQGDIAKPLHGVGSGVFEIALAFKGDAFRVVYAVQLADEIWVIHAFQKKSTKGIRAPKHEIDLIRERLKD